MTHVHLVAIGGIGMSGIARILLARGVTVSGCDAHDSDLLTALRAEGAQVFVGHDPSHLDGVDTVVVSAAIRETNPELVAARDRGLRVLGRAEALADLLVGHRAVAVAGTHGKTTTTSMLTTVLQHSGADPSYAIGGELVDGASNAHHGTGELFVVEADESDGSFLRYQPFAAIVTNVEPDHLDHHGTEEAYAQAFRDFVATVQGFVVICVDDPGGLALAQHAVSQGVEVRSYGTRSDADLRMDSLGPDGYDAVLAGEVLGHVRLPVSGDHLARNSAGALLMAIGLGVPAAQAIEGLAGYAGVRRRMELKGTVGGVRVFDDYAHHPTEIAAQLTAARSMAGGGRVVAVFQPHLYSRTAQFAVAFGQALDLADQVLVMDVYAAREDPVPGVSGALVANAVPGSKARYVPDRAEAVRDAASRCAPGDLLLTLGAGDITDLGPELLRALQDRLS